jgi:hypothetical protein
MAFMILENLTKRGAIRTKYATKEELKRGCN